MTRKRASGGAEMKEAVRRFDPAAESHTAELCFINELSNIADDPALSIARARVAPGARRSA